MSFILDALRKSENERQRGAVPDIAHVPFAIPRHRLPTWALAVIVLLGAAVVALGGAWWQSSSSERAPGTLGSSGTPPAEVPLAIPPQRAPSETFAAEPSPPSAASGRTTLPLANVALDRGSDSVGVTDSSPVAAPTATDESPDSARAADAASVESSPAQPTLPSAAALAAEGVALPELRLELHVYRRDRPRDRLLIVNGSRYREGETLAEGPRVVAIDPTGAVLSYQGREFLLTPE